MNYHIVNKTKWYGLFFVLSSTICFTVMGLIVKAASESFSPLTIVFWRSFLGILIIIGLIRFDWKQIIGENHYMLIIRGIFGTLALITCFYAIKLTLLANAISLLYTFPIFATIFSRIFLKEKLPPRIGLIIAISFVGVVFIVKPDFHSIHWGEYCGLLSGLFAGIAITTIKYLRDKENTMTVVFYFLVVAVLTAFVKNDIPHVTQSIYHFSWLAGIALFATMGQILMTYGYKFCKASEGSIISLNTVIFTIIAGFIFYGEIPDIQSIVGIILIILSSFIIFYQLKNGG